MKTNENVQVYLDSDKPKHKQITAIINVPDDETEEIFKSFMNHWHGYQVVECTLDTVDPSSEKAKPKYEARVIDAHVGALGGISCHEEHCIYSHDCASHSSAGNYRSEGGFSPELVVLENSAIGCKSINTPPYDDEDIRTDEFIPENYKSLGQGEVCLKDGKIVQDGWI